MAREFQMGIRLNYHDNDFTRGIRQASRQSREFGDAMRGAERQAGGLRSTVGGLVAAMGGMAAAKGAWNWLVGANADMEQYQNTLTVVMGSQEKALETLAWANKFAAQTPFEIPQVIEATTRMSAYGISAQKTLGIVGDMASVMGKDLMQAVEAVADAQTGELERLKEFGITKGMLEEQANLLGTNPINNKGQITDFDAFNAALFSLMEKRFKGGMEMQAQSFKGMTSNAADFMGTMGRELGKPLFDSARNNLEVFLGTLNRLQDSGAIDAFIKKAHQAFAVIGNEVRYAQKVVAAGFRAIWNATAPVFKMIKDNWASISPYVQGVAVTLGALVAVMTAMRTATMIASVAMRILSAAMLTNPVGWIILAIGLLVGWFIKLNGGIEGTKAALMGWINAIKNSAQAGAMISTTSTIIQQAFRWVIAAGMAVYTWFMTNWPQIRDTIVAVFQYVYAALAPLITSIVTNILNAFQAVYNFFVTYWPGIQRLFAVFWAWVSPFLTAALKIVWSIIKNGFDLVVGVISGVWDMAIGIIKAAWAIISGILGIGLALLVGDWKGAWDAMLGMLQGVWDGIATFFSGLGGLFYDSGKAIINTLVDGIKSVASAPVNAVKGILDNVREFLPFSDAKKGPLSQLTYSGGAIMTTLGEGVQQQAGVLAKTVSGAFGNLGLNDMSVTATAAQPGGFSSAPLDIPAGKVSTTAPAAPGGGNTTIQVSSLVERVEIIQQPGEDGDDLVDRFIDRLHARAKDAAGILANAKKGVLLNNG